MAAFRPWSPSVQKFPRNRVAETLWLHEHQCKGRALFVLPNGDDDDNAKRECDDKSDQPQDASWIQRRLEKASFFEIRRDAVLVTCFVLSRFMVYDILTSVKVTPGWEVQDVVWLTGTFSSATVLVIYWTVAGLLSKSFERGESYGPVQVLVNVALCCPIWLATEHFMQFGPSNIGGNSLSEAIASGFLGLASFMTLARIMTTRIMTTGWV